MDLSGLLTDDSRTPLEKLRRPALQKICKENKIPFDPTGPADKLRKLIEGSGVDYMRKDLFQKAQFQDENGMMKETVHPIVKPHATSNKDINYDAIIEARAATQEKADENTELKERLAKLEALLTKTAKPEKSDIKELYKETFGHYPKGRMKPETMQAQIDGKNAT